LIAGPRQDPSGFCRLARAAGHQVAAYSGKVREPSPAIGSARATFR
jgi:hypothetical protein